LYIQELGRKRSQIEELTNQVKKREEITRAKIFESCGMSKRGLSTFILMIILFMISSITTLWFTPRCGFSGVIAAFTVALKQLAPEQEIKLLFALSVRAKHLPGILLLANLAFLSLGFPSESFPFTCFGTIVSWIYLRFYQKKESSVGDRNESFSFASFFPEPLQPSISVISKITFNILKLCRCCANDISATTDPNTPDTLDSASERRRARALRALDQRMQQMKQSSQTDIRLTENLPDLPV